MPYITKNRRDALVNDSLTDHDDYTKTAGELNYQFSVIISNHLLFHGMSYQIANDIVGALDNTKDEFRRRFLHPYEDLKKLQNGDVAGYSEIREKIDKELIKEIRNQARKKRKK